MSTISRPRYVTAAQIKRAGACWGMRGRFRALFGERGKVLITKDTAVALAQAFNPGWASSWLLTPKQRAVYDRDLPRALRKNNASEAPYAEAEDLMRGMRGTNVAAVQAQVELEQLRRKQTAQAEAFAVAYNSPRK